MPNRKNVLRLKRPVKRLLDGIRPQTKSSKSKAKVVTKTVVDQTTPTDH